MRIIRTSPLTGIATTLDLDITAEQLVEFGNRHRTGKLVQHIFPLLSDAEREFILTGYTPSDWDRMFPKEEDK